MSGSGTNFPVDLTALVGTSQITNQVLTAMLAALEKITTASSALTVTDDTTTVTGTLVLTIVGGTVSGTTPNATITITSEGVTFTDGTHTISDATQLTVVGGTISGTAPDATLTITGASGVTVTDGTDSVAGATTLTFSGGATVSGATPNATITPPPPGVTFTDGSHTVANATQLAVTGGTIGGTAPNATLTVTGAVTGTGTADVVPKWTGSTTLGNSDFSDTLSVAGSATAVLEDSPIPGTGVPGLLVSGTAAGFVATSPTTTGGSLVSVLSYGASYHPVISTLAARGSRSAPTATQSGDVIGLIEATGYTGSTYASGMTVIVTAQSAFSGSPTSTIDCENASNLGWHIRASGALAVDNGIVAGTGTATAVAGAATVNAPSGIVTSEALSGATTYALTLTNSFIAASSVIQVTVMNSAGTATWPVSIVCSTGSAVITVAFASALTGTAVLNISVNN